MRIALVYPGIHGPGGYPAEFRRLASEVAKQDATIDLIDPRIRGDLRRLITGIARRTYDVIHVVGLFVPASLLVAVLVARTSQPLVFSPLAHQSPFQLARRRRMKTAAARIGHALVRGPSVAWHYLSPWERDLPRRRTPNFVAGLGIPVPDSPALSRVEERSLPPRLSFVGRKDVFQKGLDVYIEAVALLPPRAPRTGTLSLAGREYGQSADVLRRLIRDADVGDRITLLGAIPLEELSSLSWLIYPTRFDGFPRPIRHALSVGVPVITTPESNMAWIIRRFRAGLIVNAGDAGALARAIERARRMSTAEWRAYSEGATRAASALSWNRVAATFVTGYQSAAGTKRPAADTPE